MPDFESGAFNRALPPLRCLDPAADRYASSAFGPFRSALVSWKNPMPNKDAQAGAFLRISHRAPQRRVPGGSPRASRQRSRHTKRAAVTIEKLRGLRPHTSHDGAWIAAREREEAQLCFNRLSPDSGAKHFRTSPAGRCPRNFRRGADRETTCPHRCRSR